MGLNMATPYRAELVWKRYKTMYDATRPYKGRRDCVVYTLTDEEDHPIYIGAYLHGRKSGFLERYQGQTGAIDAAMRGTKKSVFVADVDKGLARIIEGFLTRKELDAGAELTNRKVPRTSGDVELDHSGDPPSFRYVRKSREITQL